MNRPPISAKEVERLLREAGVSLTDTPLRGRRPPRTPLARFLRRLRWRLLWLAMCALAALVGLFWLSSAQVGDPVGPPPPIRPILPPHGHVAPPVAALDARFGAVEAFAAPGKAAALGLGWERVSFWWKDLQPDGPNSWNVFATGHDAAINTELAAGRQLTGLLINTPDWAAVDPALHGASVPSGLYLPYNDSRNYWGHFVSLIAKRYAGRIDDWIIWNEVNIPNGHWHTWGGTVADYAQLVKVAYRAARAVNPHARIVLAGDPYWYDHGAFFVQLLRDLTADHTHGAYFDVVDLHLYSRPSDTATIVPWYRATLARFGLRKPIWIAETNAIPYDDPAHPLPRGNFYATLDDQASFIVQAFAIDLALGVQRIEVNRMVDGSDVRAGGDPFGLVRDDGSVRPAFYAYRTVVTLFSHVTGGAARLNSPSGVDLVTLHRPGATITVVWDQHPTPTTTRLAALGAMATVYDKFGQPRAIHAHQGVFSLRLAGSTDNTNSANPADYVVGGSPLIVVQPTR